MKEIEESVREAVAAAKDLDRQWHVDVLQDQQGIIRIRQPIYGPYESQAERDGLEAVLVSVDGWDSGATFDPAGCDSEEEREAERFNAERDLFDELVHKALEQIENKD